MICIARRGPSNVVTPQEEVACQLFVAGATRTEAMRQAKYSENTIRKKGAYIFQRDRVKRRVQELREANRQNKDENSNEVFPVRPELGAEAVKVLEGLMKSASLESVQLQAALQILRLVRAQHGGAEEKIYSVSTRALHDKLKTKKKTKKRASSKSAEKANA